MTYCNGETSVIRPDLTSPGAYILFLGESLISQPSGEVHTPVWSQAFMGPVGHSDPLYEGSPMEVDSFWRCTGSAGVRPSVESGKDTNERLSRYHLQRCASIGAKGGRRLPGALIYSFHRIQSVMATNRTPRKPKLMAENSTMNRPVCPLTCFVYSRKVIRLASDATSVPAPPIFTPTSSPR